MEALYFDHNVIIDIQNKRKATVVESIENIDNDNYQIFFSPAHVEEIAALAMHHDEDKETIDDALELLAKITNSKALLPYKKAGIIQTKCIGVYISNEHPKETYKRVVDLYENNHIAENHQKEKIANGDGFEKKTGVSSKKTNNIDIQREIDIFKPMLHQIIVDNYQRLAANEIFHEYLPSRAPRGHEIKFEHLGEYFPLHEMTIEKIFEFLELIRYFPDKSTQFLSGLHDTTHAIYAAYCDVFVTNDKKLKNKAKATYDWLGVNTLILDPYELVDYLANKSNTRPEVVRQEKTD
jgi:rRNA-processing protein FCF1